MRKIKIPALIITAAAAIAGFALRRYQILNVFEADTGLPTRGAPATWALGILAVIMLVMALAIAVGAGKRGYESYSAALSHSTPGFIVSAAAGAAVIVGAVISVISGESAGVSQLVLTILALASGISLIVCAKAGLGGEDTNGLRLATIVPAVYLCYWIVIAYKAHSSDAVMLDYVYTLLAIAAGTMYYYYAAGFAFKKPMYRRTVFCAVVTVFFAAAAAGDLSSASDTVIFLALAVNAFVGLISLLSEKPEKVEAPAETPAEEAPEEQ
jgi:hypothetical protein